MMSQAAVPWGEHGPLGDVFAGSRVTQYEHRAVRSMVIAKRCALAQQHPIIDACR